VEFSIKEQTRTSKSDSEWRSVAILGSELDRIAEVVSFFKIPFEINPDNVRCHDIAILYREYGYVLSDYGLPLLCVPSDTEEFFHFLDMMNVKSKCVNEEFWIDLRIQKKMKISFNVSKLFYFSGPIDVVVSSKGIPLLCRIRGTNVSLLCIDLVGEIERLFELGMNLRPTTFFKFSSRLNLASLVPRGLGDVLLRLLAHVDVSQEEFQSHMSSLDGLRYLVLAAAVISAQKPFRTLGFWKNGSKYALTITHDVDTKYGFEVGIRRLREVERKYGVKSAWNIPSGRYRINPKFLESLVSEGCEIGSHGFRHDGKLIFQKPNDLVSILRACKETLERLGNCEVKGFRSPLLQHSHRILQAVLQAGFLYDSSLPSWEAHCRTAGTSHGIKTVYPLIEDDLVELPVTMPQDHQLIRLAGLQPDELLEFWRTIRRHIKSIGGLCNIIIHPDKGLFGEESALPYYKEFIKEVVSDEECWLTLPSKVAEWWLFRRNSIVTNREPVPCRFEKSHHDNSGGMAGFDEYTPQDFVFE